MSGGLRLADEWPGRPPGKAELRLWLRLLSAAGLIESRIRARLRAEFEVTLPQFDLLAALERARGPLTMSALSERLMVSGGNVTGIVERLRADGWLDRRPAPEDRRVQHVALTESGRARFAAMAAAHEGWLRELFGGLSAGEAEELMRLLGRVKQSVERSEGGA
ncbi:MAG TPA: MarR family transcriptional regulator [Alphaproteobacteria bacterium]|nr:MarR family transcriptional regulator [Alphaproteobacteria bacterium]